MALFVAPVLVLLSHFIGPAPMDLVFTLPEVIAVALAVAITSQIAGDGDAALELEHASGFVRCLQGALAGCERSLLHNNAWEAVLRQLVPSP